MPGKDYPKLIARDQIGKVTATFEKERQVRSGVTQYIWRTVRDNRVRERHEDLQGKTFSWDDPPVVDPKTGRKAHPGEDFQCRCWAEPVLDRGKEGAPAGEDEPRPKVGGPGPVPDKPPLVTEVRHPELRWRELSPAQSRAQQNADWLRDSPIARATATKEERRDWLVWDWVNGSQNRTGTLMKVAAIREFRLSGIPYTKKGPFHFDASEISAVAQDLREIYQDCQRLLRKKYSQATLRLYRGEKTDTSGDAPGAIQSWTTSLEVAQKFAGPSGLVWEEDIPLEKILMFRGGPGWVDGIFGNQEEFLIMK